MKGCSRVIYNTPCRAAQGAADLERASREDRRPQQACGRREVENASLIVQGVLAEAWGLTTQVLAFFRRNSQNERDVGACGRSWSGLGGSWGALGAASGLTKALTCFLEVVFRRDFLRLRNNLGIFWEGEMVQTSFF